MTLLPRIVRLDTLSRRLEHHFPFSQPTGQHTWKRIWGDYDLVTAGESAEPVLRNVLRERWITVGQLDMQRTPRQMYVFSGTG